VPDGNRDGRVDVAKSALFDPGDLHYCGHPDAHHRHHEHVHFCRADDWLVHPVHRDRVAGASHPKKGSTRETSEMRLKENMGGLAVPAAAVLGLAMIACTPGKSHAATGAVPAAITAARVEASMPAAEVGAAPKINAARAMQYTKEVTAFGARPI